jgi:hypothetical protein
VGVLGCRPLRFNVVNTLDWGFEYFPPPKVYILFHIYALTNYIRLCTTNGLSIPDCNNSTFLTHFVLLYLISTEYNFKSLNYCVCSSRRARQIYMLACVPYSASSGSFDLLIQARKGI